MKTQLQRVEQQPVIRTHAINKWFFARALLCFGVLVDALVLGFVFQIVPLAGMAILLTPVVLIHLNERWRKYQQSKTVLPPTYQVQFDQIDW